MKLSIPKFIAIASLLLPALAGAQELFSVNLWSPSRANLAGSFYTQEDWLRTLRLEEGQSTGVLPTVQWDNLNVATIPVNNTATINGSEGGTATFKIVNKRNQSAYRWTVLRDGTTDPTIAPEYMADGAATLLDGKMVGTEFDGFSGPVDPTKNAVIEVSDIPFPVYDVIIYFGMNFDQFAIGGAANAGRGYIDFNETGLKEWFLAVGDDPNRLLPTNFTEVAESGDTGNYVRYEKVVGSSFTARVYGHGFNHGGITGFQILQVDTEVGPVDPGNSTVTASTAFVAADDSSTATITVMLKDAIGLPVAGKDVKLEAQGAAVVEPATPVVTDEVGQAVFTVKSATPGAEVFTATNLTDGDMVITQTANVTFVGLADAGESTLASSPPSVVANGAVPSTITVSLKDAGGSPAGGRSVSLAATSGPGTPDIVPANALTDADGVATFSVTTDTPGTVVFTATADSVSITETASVEFVDASTPFVLNVNFWTFTPAGMHSPVIESELFGPAGGLDTRWNQYAANSSTGTLLDSTGVGTSVAFTTNFSEGRAANAANAPMFRSTLTDFGRGASRSFNITGLPPGALYNIWLASYRDGIARERTYGRWTANNPTSSSSVQFIDNRDGANGTTFVEGYNYIVFENVVADEEGRISFDGKGMMPDDGADDEYRLGLSGFQMVPVGKAVITTFSAPGATSVINQSDKSITLTVPFGTNLETLAPVYTLSSGSGVPASESPPSPSFALQNPTTYTITDDSTTPPTVNEYTVTVVVEKPVATLVIDLGTGTDIEGGSFIGSGPANLPIPALPTGSILRSISTNLKLESTTNDNFASDFALLLDPTPETPGTDFLLEITNGLQPLGATTTSRWPEDADFGVGTELIDTKTDANWAESGAIDLATTGVFLGNAYRDASWVAGRGGNWSGTITLTYDIVTEGSPFSVWSGGQPFAGDANGDGVSNGIAFLLGAANPDANALGLLPAVSEDAGMVLSFQMLNAAGRGDAKLFLEHSGDLGADDPWTVVAVPDASSTVDGLTFVVTPNGSLNEVVATIPASEAINTKLFGRLSAEEN